MAWFRRTAHDPDELNRMKSDIQLLRNTIEAHDRRRREAAAATLEQSDPTPSSGEDAQAVRAVAARLDELAERLSDLDARVTAVSTELANQVSELGNDIEALAVRPPSEGAVDEAVLGELRNGQTRLANEQARYQIAFREDLARLAEQLRRPGQAPHS